MRPVGDVEALALARRASQLTLKQHWLTGDVGDVPDFFQT